MRIFIILMLSLLVASFVSAQPSINGVSGTLEHGETIIVSGTGFGVKDPAPPYLWAPFDYDTNPSPLGITSSWSQLANFVWINDGCNGSGGCLEGVPGMNNWNIRPPHDVVWNAYDHKHYWFKKTKRNFVFLGLDQWHEWDDWYQEGDWVFVTLNGENILARDGSPARFMIGGGHWPRMNWKNWRLWAVDGSGQYSYMATSNSYYKTSSGISENYPVASIYNQKDAVIAGDWLTEEMIMRVNSEATSVRGTPGDGYLLPIVNSQPARTNPHGWKMRDENASDLVQYYVQHGFFANARPPAHWTMWVDDIYFDNSWARVMIGNQATFNESDHREMFIPQAWGDGVIDVVVHHGAFSSGETVYLYVFDEDGVHNEVGFPLVLGQSSSVGVPGDLNGDGVVSLSEFLSWSYSSLHDFVVLGKFFI